jgi:hypothetical protein
MHRSIDLEAKLRSKGWRAFRWAIVLWLTLPGCLAWLTVGAGEPPQAITRQTFHLRSGTQPEWDEFADKTPDGAGLVLRFSGQANDTEATLLIAQDDVKLDWGVELNGKRIGTLFLMEAPLVHTLSVPPHLLRTGENTLTVLPPKENDDILVGEMSLVYETSKQALQQAGLDIRVLDEVGGGQLPCRITILDQAGRLAAISGGDSPMLAVRPGVVYTPDGAARVELRSGDYLVCATRGFEYGLARAHVSVRPGEIASVQLQLRREVPTPGLICSDTHVHTFTYARHGDATVEERVLTLAGEGIELPISTEHGTLVDLAGAIYRMGVQNWMTPVVGEEVTTAKGHFNIFPVNIAGPLPDDKVTDWPRLISLLRATPGVQVIVLNHPRNIHSDFQPFAATNFNATTGENLRGFEFSFDAVEVANSSALQSDWMISFRDWFALLNYGYRFTAVGSSDGHDVSRYIVGQGRTYIASKAAEPSRIDVSEVCLNLRRGRALVSLGLLANMTVNERFAVGDLATNLGEEMVVRVKVLGPSWVSADKVQLYANGNLVREERPSPAALASANQQSSPVNIEVAWVLPRPKHDTYLVALATGPGVKQPFWAIARPYHPSSSTWVPSVLSATNPIWIDADGDGEFTPAREYARRLVAEHGTDASKLIPALKDYDQAVVSQVAALCRAAGVDLRAFGRIKSAVGQQ